MAPEFRYSLTRICLRSGQLSLSRRIAEIFPQSGTVRVLDTVDDREFEFSVDETRKVSGVGGYLERHRLGVNDQIQVRRLNDGRIAFTAMPRKAHREFDEQMVLDLLDSLVGETPRTEEEIRALHPQIPASYPLADALDTHPAFRLRAGRWVGESTGGGSSENLFQRKPEPRHEQAAESSAPAGESTPAPSGAEPDDSGRDEENRAAGHGADARPERSSHEGASRERAEAGSGGAGSTESRGRGVGGDEASTRSHREARRSRDRTNQSGRAAAVTPYPRGVLFPGEAALNSQRPAGDLRLVNRAREALAGFGYRVEGLPHGMLLAKADLGRRKHSVLVRVLAEGERLDWAALLARRREQTADYLAVMGDHRDLHRLTAPAELARTSLWSWDGIARVQNLAQIILIGPYDLEPHFAKDGMFGAGLQQFERSVGRMIAEKGTLSAVLARLGSLRAPAVFVLDDLVEGELQREQVARALDILAQAPFHLVAKVDRGEYCLRHTVAESLAHLSEYALSLGERLPGAQGRRQSGSRSVRQSASGEMRESAADREGLELAEDS